MYDNIMKALNPGDGLSTQQKADNYAAFNKMMDENVYIPDLLKKISELEQKVDAMGKPKENPIDAELFGVMEQAVKDDPKVVDAKHVLQNEKTRVISEICMRDESYRKVFDDYRRTVNQVYVTSKQDPTV